MSEDVSATMRVGITVILVAALVATVLNLMVMSQSILSNGQITLQSGVNQVSSQEFEAYNNKTVSGTQVQTAIALFQGRDVGIIVETNALAQLVPKAVTTAATGTASEQFKVATGTVGAADYTATGKGASLINKVTTSRYDTSTAAIIANGNWSVAVNYGALFVGAGRVEPSSTTGAVCSSTTGAVWAIPVAHAGATSLDTTAKGGCVYADTGSSNYSGTLLIENGMTQSDYNTKGTVTLGNPQYLLPAAQYRSTLIKDATGSIIGIYFRQVK